jgi:hypothetical protein
MKIVGHNHAPQVSYELLRKLDVSGTLFLWETCFKAQIFGLN